MVARLRRRSTSTWTTPVTPSSARETWCTHASQDIPAMLRVVIWTAELSSLCRLFMPE
jgi:hypothetical protein